MKIGRVESNTSLYLPITHVKKVIVQYRYTSPSGTSNIMKEITDAVTSLFEKGTAPIIINGISNILTEIVNDLTGIAREQKNVIPHMQLGLMAIWQHCLLCVRILLFGAEN